MKLDTSATEAETAFKHGPGLGRFAAAPQQFGCYQCRITQEVHKWQECIPLPSMSKGYDRTHNVCYHSTTGTEPSL